MRAADADNRWQSYTRRVKQRIAATQPKRLPRKWATTYWCIPATNALRCKRSTKPPAPRCAEARDDAAGVSQCSRRTDTGRETQTGINQGVPLQQ